MVLEAQQLDLIPPNRSARLDALFEKHRREHPEIYMRLVELARKARAAGWEKIGIRMIWERVRWERGPKQHDEDGVYINDWMTSRYARAIADENDDLRGIFDFRRLRATDDCSAVLAAKDHGQRSVFHDLPDDRRGMRGK